MIIAPDTMPAEKFNEIPLADLLDVRNYGTVGVTGASRQVVPETPEKAEQRKKHRQYIAKKGGR